MPYTVESLCNVEKCGNTILFFSSDDAIVFIILLIWWMVEWRFPKPNSVSSIMLELYMIRFILLRNSFSKRMVIDLKVYTMRRILEVYRALV